MRCKYSKCGLNGDVNKEDAIKIKNSYYHKECYEEMEDKKKIRELFLNQINKTELYSILNRNIENIIHKKKIESKYLLYCVEYAIKNKIIIYNSNGLHLLINNYKIKTEYQNKIKQEKLKEIKNQMKTEKTDTETSFEFKIQKNNWGNILR